MEKEIVDFVSAMPISVMLKVHEKLQRPPKNTDHLMGDQIRPIIVLGATGSHKIPSQKDTYTYHGKYTKVTEGVKTSIYYSIA
ncbi:MAG: hypothetical protein PHY36_05145 [Methanocellales archaeon]|nr:hypothetical protein [Methanocellales archaeon]MDD5447250.1 hypothetical protein [Methanocellales archaeon]